MTKQIKPRLINAVVEIYYAVAGEDPALSFQVKATHTSLGLVRLCYTSKRDAIEACKFINEFGVCPPSPMESERRAQLKESLERQQVTTCPQCGEDVGIEGLCDQCELSTREATYLKV